MSEHLSYIPKPGSLAEQVVNFFRLHPDARLSIDDVREKFAFPKGNVTMQLTQAMRAGLIARTDLADPDLGFWAGHKLFGIVNPSATSQPKPSKGPGRGKGRGRLPAFDIDAVQVDKGVPIPKGIVRKKHEGKWAPLLAKLTQAHDSIAVPHEIKGTLSSYIRKLEKTNTKNPARYKVGNDHDGIARVWRIA